MKYILFLLLLAGQAFSQISYTMDSSGFSVTVMQNGSRVVQDSNGTFLTTSVIPKSFGTTGAVASPATAGVVDVPMKTRIITITPTGACTLNALGGVTGQSVTFIFLTSGVASFTVTFGTNFREVSSLVTGTITGRRFCVSFIYDGTLWVETARTASIP